MANSQSVERRDCCGRRAPIRENDVSSLAVQLSPASASQVIGRQPTLYSCGRLPRTKVAGLKRSVRYNDISAKNLTCSLACSVKSIGRRALKLINNGGTTESSREFYLFRQN